MARVTPDPPPSPGSDDRGEPLNLARLCIEAHAVAPASAERPAFTFLRDAPDGDSDAAGTVSESWTYAELWERVQAVGRGLLARGLTPGDRVLVRLPHSPEYAFAFFGATLAGLVPIPASPQLTAEEAAFLLDDAEAAALVSAPETRVEGFAGVAIDVSELATLDGPGPLPETRAEDPAFLIYTSGTTARPKGVLHAHRTIRGRMLMRDGWEGFGPDDVTLHAGTLNWSYTLGVGLMDPWLAGAHALLFGGRYDPAAWPAILVRHRVTVFCAVPTVYRQMLKYGRPEDAGLTALRHGLCAGEPLPVALLEEWRARVGTELYEALGMTELSTYISSGPATPVRPGSPGRPQPGRRVAILPEDEEAPSATEPLSAGAIGRLAAHRSDPGLMLGYWQRPEEERAVYRGEWFVGGDLAALDEDGYLWFHGRSDDVIKSFGYRLSPVEIEATVAAHPAVAEAAVVAVTVEEGKTLVIAAVVPQDGALLDEGALRRHAEEHLAGYKRPHEYRVVEALPRTRNGKVQRSTLAREFAAAAQGKART
jgi:acyl-coenzyme A synthetase/AMP-(fatty) acid ligase